jgi:hypothetical protein
LNGLRARLTGVRRRRNSSWHLHCHCLQASIPLKG